MSNWKQKQIGKFCRVKGGKRLPAGSEFANGKTPYPYLRVTDMVNASIDDSALVYVTPEIEKFIRNYKISKNDIYVTIAGTLGLFGTIPDHLDNAQLTENAAKLTTIDFNELDKEYLKYYLNSIFLEEQLYREIGVGGGVPKLALYRIEKLTVKYPSIPAQQRIAKILRTIDGQIEKTEAIIAKYKAIKQGLMQDLFTRGIDVSTGKLRPRYQDAPELYKPSSLGMIPKDWDIDAVQNLCSKVTDGAHFSPKPLDYGYRIGNVKDMTDYGFDYEGMTKISQNDFKELARQNCSPKKGDVLLSKDGTIGRVIVFNDDEQLVLLSSIAILTPYEHINSTYLGYLFKTSYFDVQLYQLQSGSALKRLVLSDIRKIKFPTPKDRKEQELIASRLERADKLLEEEMDHRHKIQQIKKGMMSDLLSGKVRVQIDEEAVC
ncbi:restriction endonuclease subunit S [Pontibacter burrus]|uniref:Restriction endonuclease subunit S n=1 Tax=Pontibacter burrus TaxID=2704466 RepID=A0A6B3LQ36_9BACT|nr:restriction endonuclease subunit S [Pontibacter burrus]NEM97185.1 restriction endonuclease subunit S [Pontibacter burrus]